MSEPQAMHVSDERILRYLDGELEEDEGPKRQHIDSCVECRARLDAINRAGAAYLKFHRDMLKAQDPAPPRPWEDLRPALNELDASASRVRGGRWVGWLAAAAAIVVIVGVYYRVDRVAPVSAAELLHKSAAGEASRNLASRIRVRTARHSIVRAAVLRAGQSVPEEPALETMFLAARFSWQDL
jgi:hypothetical protein